MVPAAASAQAHLQLLGGETKAGTRHPFFGAQLGVRIHFIEFDAEVGHFNDILPKGVLEALNQLQRDRGLPVEGIASVPATYAVATLRIIPGVGVVRPFVSGSFGAARLEPRINVVIEGISFGDVFGLTSLGTETRPMGMGSAGLRLDFHVAHIEAGYRWVVVFTDFHRDLNFGNDKVLTFVNAVYGALGVRF